MGTTKASRAHALEVSLLGGFAVRAGGREVPASAFERRKARSLLKLLALQKDGRIHRDRALELLWPDLEARAAASQLYKAMHQVRQALAGARAGIELRDELLVLGAPEGVAVDVERFEALAEEALRSRDPESLARAAEACGGDLLPEDLYEAWTQEPRERIAERHAAVLVALGEAHLQRDRIEDAADAFRQAAARDPLDERAQRGLMLAYARLGDRERALQKYRALKDALASELQATPSAESARLAAAIERGEVAPARPQAPAPQEAASLPPLVGRAQQLTAIVERLDDLSARRGGALGVEGPAGIGKTRLLREAAALARARGFHVASGRAREEEGPLPYGPFVEAVSAALAKDRANAELLPAPFAELIPALPPGAAVPKSDPLTARTLLFSGLERFFAARAKKAPLVLVLDDLHAADTASLELFHYLARRAAELPLLILAAWRPDEPGAEGALASTLHSLQRDERLATLRLPPLSHAEASELAARALGGDADGELQEQLFRWSEGNPLFARELVRQLQGEKRIVRRGGLWRAPAGDAPLPPSLRELLRRRWDRLRPAAQRLVQAAALIGRDVPVAELRAAAGAEPEFLDLLEEAAAAGVLTEASTSVRFPHALYRDAVAQQISPARARELHGRIAEALEKLNGAVEAIAHHWARAGDPARAVHYLLRAGDRAEQVFAHGEALARFSEALALAPESAPELRAHAHERIGDVHRATGDVARALAAYRAALDSAPRGDLHRKIALAAVLALDMPTAAEHLRKAEAGAEGLARARVLIAAALFDWHRNELLSAVEKAQQALAIADEKGAAVEAQQACEMLALSYLPLGRWEEGLKYELRRTAAGWSPEVVVATDGHLCLWEYHVHGEEPYRRAADFIADVERHAAAQGDLRCVAVCRYALGSMAFLRGAFPEPAQEHLEQALRLQERIGSAAGMAYTLARWAVMLTAQGNLEAAWERVQQGFRAAERASVRDHCLQRLHGAGLWNRVEAGDLEEAARLAAAVEQMEKAGPLCPACGLQLHPALAAYHLARRDLDAAKQRSERALEMAAASLNRGARALALRLQGEIAAARGDAAGAVSLLDEAAVQFAELGMRPDLERTRAIRARVA